MKIKNKRGFFLITFLALIVMQQRYWAVRISFAGGSGNSASMIGVMDDPQERI